MGFAIKNNGYRFLTYALSGSVVQRLLHLKNPKNPSLSLGNILKEFPPVVLNFSDVVSFMEEHEKSLFYEAEGSVKDLLNKNLTHMTVLQERPKNYNFESFAFRKGFNLSEEMEETVLNLHRFGLIVNVMKRYGFPINEEIPMDVKRKGIEFESLNSAFWFLLAGGGDGIGRAVCEAFAREEANVVVCDVKLDGAKTTAELLEKKHSSQRHLVVQTDVSKSKSIDELGEKIDKFYDNMAPSVVVNCAGVDPNFLGISADTEEVFDQVVSVNLKGTFLVSRKFALILKERKLPGSFVNIASICKDGFAPSPSYSATKGGIVSLTKSFAKELAKHGIRFNTVSPGIIDTQLITKGNLSPETVEAMAGVPCIAPLGRRGLPKDVAEVCLFLASEKSSYVTCSDYEVHGGLHALMDDSMDKTAPF